MLRDNNDQATVNVSEQEQLAQLEGFGQYGQVAFNWSFTSFIIGIAVEYFVSAGIANVSRS